MGMHVTISSQQNFVLCDHLVEFVYKYFYLNMLMLYETLREKKMNIIFIIVCPLALYLYLIKTIIQ